MVEVGLLLVFISTIGVLIWAVCSTIAFVGLFPLFVFITIGMLTYYIGFTNFIILGWLMILALFFIARRRQSK